MRAVHSALFVCLWATAATAGAGTVSVSFADEARFVDAGRAPWEQQANLNAIASHLQSLGERLLPPDRTLRIEIIGVDLAGETRPSALRGTDLRIVRGGADWPSITMRYTLEGNGRVLSSGEETVSDLDFSHRIAHAAREPLSHEKRMLAQWFRTRFVAP